MRESLYRWLAAVLIVASGCESSTPSPAPLDVPGDQHVRIDIQLNWFPEAEHGGYFAAQMHDYFAQEGISVTLRPGGPGFPLMENVATGQVQFGVDNADKLLRARASEADVVAVFAPLQDSPRCLMVHEESGITKLDDLSSAEGVTLAWNASQPFAQFLTKKYDLSKLTMTKYPGSIGPFLLDKQYAQQAYSISEPFLARKEGAKPTVLMLSDAGFNTYTSVLLTSRKLLTEQPELVRKVVRASQRGWLKYLEDAAETNRYIASINKEMPEDVLAFGVTELQKLCRPEGLPDAKLGQMTAERWETLARQLTEIGAIEPESVKVEQAFATEFLPGTTNNSAEPQE